MRDLGIYRAYVLTGVTNAHEVDSWWHGVATHLEHVRTDEIASAVACRAVWAFDQDTLHLSRPHAAKSPVFAAMQVLSDFDEEARREREPSFGVELSFELRVVAVGKGYVALLYTLNDRLAHAFGELPGVTPFRYWDQRKCPDGLSMERWVRRKVLWCETGFRPSVPVNVGIKLSLPPPLIFGVRIDAFVCESVEDRAAEIGHEQVVREHWRAAKGKGMLTSRHIDAAVAWVDSDPEGRAMVRDRIESVVRRLKPVVTLADLCAKPNRTRATLVGGRTR